MTRSPPRLLTLTFTTTVIEPKQLKAVWSLLLHDGSGGPTSIFRTAWRFLVFLTQAESARGISPRAAHRFRTWHSRVIRLVPPSEGCRLPLIIRLLPLPV